MYTLLDSQAFFCESVWTTKIIEIAAGVFFIFKTKNRTSCFLSNLSEMTFFGVFTRSGRDSGVEEVYHAGTVVRPYLRGVFRPTHPKPGEIGEAGA